MQYARIDSTIGRHWRCFRASSSSRTRRPQALTRGCKPLACHCAWSCSISVYGYSRSDQSVARAATCPTAVTADEGRPFHTSSPPTLPLSPSSSQAQITSPSRPERVSELAKLACPLTTYRPPQAMRKRSRRLWTGSPETCGPITARNSPRHIWHGFPARDIAIALDRGLFLPLHFSLCGLVDSSF